MNAHVKDLQRKVQGLLPKVRKTKEEINTVDGGVRELDTPTITTTTPAQNNTYGAPTIGVTKDASRAGGQTPPAPPTGPPARGSNSTH